MLFNFENISLNQLKNISEIFKSINGYDKEFVAKKYDQCAINFEETLNFLKALRLIEITKNKLIPIKEYKSLLDSNERSPYKRQSVLQEFMIDRLIARNNPLSTYINEFLSNFLLDNKLLRFKPTATERLKYKGIRNFLMELDFIQLDSRKMQYIINKRYSLYFPQRKNRYISSEELRKILNEQIKLGYEAELEIIEYEKKRLANYPLLANMIEHTAKKDIKAGYDIKSFDKTKKENKKPMPRYIEVKAVPDDNYHFYWTRNEIDKAKIYKEKYYLYLLPVLSKSGFNINKLKVIRNPFKNVYSTKKNIWLRTEEVISYQLINF